MQIGAGDSLHVVLDKSGAQLSNKGGKINLIDPSRNAAHIVTCSKGQARTDGETILF